MSPSDWSRSIRLPPRGPICRCYNHCADGDCPTAFGRTRRIDGDAQVTCAAVADPYYNCVPRVVCTTAEVKTEALAGRGRDTDRMRHKQVLYIPHLTRASMPRRGGLIRNKPSQLVCQAGNGRQAGRVLPPSRSRNRNSINSITGMCMHPADPAKSSNSTTPPPGPP